MHGGHVIQASPATVTAIAHGLNPVPALYLRSPKPSFLILSQQQAQSLAPDFKQNPVDRVDDDGITHKL